MMRFFPSPSSLSHRLAPRPFPGATPASTAAMKETLAHNLEHWHAYFNERGFHNHISHHVLALWALGAPASRIKESYEEDIKLQRPIDLGIDHSKLVVITDENFFDHVGKHESYLPYVNYFKVVVEKMGPLAAIEKYVFSQEFNFPPNKANDIDQPRMLDRFLSAVVHPMIFVGYGLEFGLPGLVIEGLAHTAVHVIETVGTTPTMFHPPQPLPGKNIHALAVLSRVLKDDKFRMDNNPGMLSLARVTELHTQFGDGLRDLVDRWVAGIDTNAAGINEVLERKLEEVVWANSLMYGVAGWHKEKSFNADFFTMHLVTSSLFLPSYHASLSPSSQLTLLRAYFTVSLTWFIMRGRPNIDINGFYEATSPVPNHPLLTSSPKPTANTWVNLLEPAINHPDDHFIKLQRSLAHFSVVFGTREFSGQEAELELAGADRLDGTLFARVAGLSAIRLEEGRQRAAGEFPPPFWDRTGFFN